MKKHKEVIKRNDGIYDVYQVVTKCKQRLYTFVIPVHWTDNGKIDFDNEDIFIHCLVNVTSGFNDKNYADYLATSLCTAFTWCQNNLTPIQDDTIKCHFCYNDGIIEAEDGLYFCDDCWLDMEYEKYINELPAKSYEDMMKRDNQ
jgi:hypothetical protein